MHNIENQKHLKDFLPLTNKISELENHRRIKISVVIDDFIQLKSRVFNPLKKAHFGMHFARESEIKYKRQAITPISRKIMSLVDYNVAKHPNEFVEKKYVTYELLKLNRINIGLHDGRHSSDFFEVVNEEINEEEKRIVTKLVAEITGLRKRDLSKEVTKNLLEYLKVGIYIYVYKLLLNESYDSTKVIKHIHKRFYLHQSNHFFYTHITYLDFRKR